MVSAVAFSVSDMIVLGSAPSFGRRCCHDDITIETEEGGSVEYFRLEVTPNKFYVTEHFDDPEQFEKKRIKPKAKKEPIDEDIAKYDGVWALENPSSWVWY